MLLFCKTFFLLLILHNGEVLILDYLTLHILFFLLISTKWPLLTSGHEEWRKGGAVMIDR